MATVLGEGPFADAVRKALEYAQSRGVDLSGVEVEVVPDPSITDAGAYTEPLGGLRFRIRYNPRYAGDVVLASHEAGHVAYWTWQNRKRGGVQYVPDVDEPLAEAFGAVIARQLFGWPVTFKGAPLNLTQVLPQRTTYITATVGGKPVAVKVPEWGDYRSRYKAGIFLSPYFYNMTNWSHVFGNFTAMPGDVIETVHKAWLEGAVETVPGWGAVWRTTPTWSWPPNENTDTSQQRNSVEPAKPNTQKADASDAKTTPTDTAITTTTGSTSPGKEQNTSAVVTAQPSADVSLPPSNVQPPRYFSSDITPSPAAPEWSSYISGRRVLVVLRNWPFLDTATLKETRKDHVAGVGVVSGDRLRFEDRVPVPRVVDPNAWIELVDEKTGKVLTRLRSDELYKLTNEGAPLTLFWSHVAVEEKWPGWERFLDRAKELDEKLGVWRPSGGAVAPPSGSQQTIAVNPDGTASAVRVSNAPTEYVSPKVPDDVRRQFENLLSELKKLGEGVNLRNVGEVHDKFIQLRDKALDIARAYPQLVDEANKAVGGVGSAIRETSDKLYSALAKAAGRDSFWRGDGDVKTPIGAYKYDPATGAFLLSLYDRPTAENIVGFIKDDGTPVVVKKTQNMSEALEEYNKLVGRPQSKPAEQDVVKKIGAQQPSEGQQTDLLRQIHNADVSRSGHKTRGLPVPTVQTQPLATQSNQQIGFLQSIRDAVEFLTHALKTGASVTLTILGGARQTPADDSSIQQSSRQQFVETKPQSESRAVYNRRRGMPTLDSEFVQAPGGKQKTEEFVEARSLRPPDYVLVETKAKSSGLSQPSAGDSGFVQSSSRQQKTEEFVAVRPSRPLDYVLAEEEARRAVSAGAPDAAAQQSGSSSGYRPADYLVSQKSGSPTASPPTLQTAEASPSSSKRYRGRPVAVAI
jgi:hypothetical protein